MGQPDAGVVLLESLRRRRVPKNARIVHLVGTVGTKTLIHPHALIVNLGNFLLKRVNHFVWRATREPFPTNTVRRSAKCAQRDLHKAKNEVSHAIIAIWGNLLLKIVPHNAPIVTKVKLKT